MNEAIWMFLGILAWETGKFVGGLIAGWYYDKEEYSPCPHGYEDWDDCPDCCH